MNHPTASVLIIPDPKQQLVNKSRKNWKSKYSTVNNVMYNIMKISNSALTIAMNYTISKQ